MVTIHIPQNDKAELWLYGGIIRQNNKIKDINRKAFYNVKQQPRVFINKKMTLWNSSLHYKVASFYTTI